MSDAMSAIEIEDVLSSIRRLVSEDLRPAAAKPVPAEARLLLTPALRVVPQAPEDRWDDEEDWTEEPLATGLSPSGWSLPEAEPEPAELDIPLSVPMQPASVRVSADEPVAPTPLPPHRFTLTQAARVLPPESSPPPEPWDQPVDVIETLVPPPEMPRPASAAEQVWADRAAAEAIAGLEAETEYSETFEEDFPEAFEDPLEVISESDPAFQDDDLAEDEDELAEATYDEVLLRELVRDILREELAGALGEKITRNVRKLVRAEIAQALAARDLA